MKQILSVALIVAIFFLVGCGQEKPARLKDTRPTVSAADAQKKVELLALGLDVREDDMKEVTFYRCPVDIDLHPSIWIIPYAAVDKNFNVTLHQDILYVGHEPLYFDKLYIKTDNGVETFRYSKVVKSYAGEEYNGLLDAALYNKLQSAIDDGYAKFRLEGRTFGERELTEKELVSMEKVFAIYEFLRSVKVEK